MAVRDEQVFFQPSLSRIQECRPPFHILRVYRKTSRARDIIEGSVPEISIQRVRVARKIGFENVDASVAVVIGCRGAFMPLLLAACVLINGESTHPGQSLQMSRHACCERTSWESNRK